MTDPLDPQPTRSDDVKIPDPIADRPDDDDLATVCDACLRCSCWHGIFMCEEAKSAGTVDKTVRELRLLDLEHPDYWVTRYWRGPAYTGMSVSSS